MKVRLAAGIAEVLELDAELPKGITAVRRAGREIELEGSLGGFVALESLCVARTSQGWAQPSWYYASAGAAAKRIRTAITKEDRRND